MRLKMEMVADGSGDGGVERGEDGDPSGGH